MTFNDINFYNDFLYNDFHMMTFFHMYSMVSHHLCTIFNRAGDMNVIVVINHMTPNDK